jgi:hypothetical protein
MKVKTATLVGPALRWAVAQCEGPESVAACYYDDDGLPRTLDIHDSEWEPDLNWGQGGPILEREGIELLCNLSATEAARFKDAHADWQAFHRSNRKTEARQCASTPLIAGMRFFVVSRLGEEIDVPAAILELRDAAQPDWPPVADAARPRPGRG